MTKSQTPKATKTKVYDPHPECDRDETDQSHKVRTLIVSRYPINANEIRKLRLTVDEAAEILIVSTIVKGGFKSFFELLKHSSCKHLVLYLDDEWDRPLLPALMAVSTLIRCEQKSLIVANKTCQKLSKFSVIQAFMLLFRAVAISGIKSCIAIRRCRHLRAKPRIRIAQDQFDHDSMMMIKLMLWFGIQSGGASTHFLGIARAAHRAGKKVSAISSEFMPAEDNDPNLEFKRLPSPQVYITPRELNHFSGHFDFTKPLKELYPDFSGVIYQRLSAGSFVGVELSRYYGVPLVVEYNGSERWLSDNWGTPYTFMHAVEEIESLMLKHAHMVVAISEVLKKQLILQGVEEKRIVVVKNGYDPTQVLSRDESGSVRRSMRDQLGLTHDAMVFCFVGTFGPWHGAEDLAKAIEIFFARADQKTTRARAHFLFVGDGVKRSEVQDIVHRHIEAGSVTMVGNVQPRLVSSYLAASDVCLVPTMANKDGSEFFGSPTKLFEYISSEKPVIATNVGQTMEVLEGAVDVDDFASQADPENSMQCGIIVPSGNPHKLADAFECALNAPDWCKAAGQNAALRAQKKYSWDHSFAEIECSFNKIILNEKPPPKTRVLINGLHSKAGGGLTYLLNMLPLLGAHPHLDLYVLLSKKQVVALGDKIDNVHVQVTKFGEMGFWSLLVFEQIYVPFFARRLNVDVTYSPANYGPFLVKNRVLLMRNALSVQNVEQRFSKIAYWQLLSWATYLSRLMAKRLISVSLYADKATRWQENRVPANQVKIIPHGVSEQFYDEDLKRSKSEIVSVSNLYVQKNFHTLLSAMVHVHKACPDVRLTIIGEAIDAAYYQRLMKMIEKLGLADVVSLLGSKSPDELRGYYGRCALFAFPSTVETFGNPLVEAMACGAPIVCSDTAAMPEVVGDAAILFDPFSIQDVAEKIIQVLQDDALRSDMEVRSKARAQLFSWENTAALTARVLVNASR